MPCACVSVGVVAKDLAALGIAAGATIVIVVGTGVALGVSAAALETYRERKLMEDLAAAEIPSVILDREALIRHKLHQRLQQAGVADQFASADVLMETHSGQVFGLNRTDEGGYAVTAKWGGPAHTDPSANLAQQYSYVKIKKEFQARGYSVVQEEVLEDRSIRVIVRRWE